MNFAAGDQFVYGGVQYRVLAGNRCAGDLIIEFKLPGSGYHRPQIAHTLILTAFKYQVEENNYGADGQIKRAQGGWYLLQRIRDACMDGWKAAADKTTQERIDAERRRNEAIQAQLSLPA